MARAGCCGSVQGLPPAPAPGCSPRPSTQRTSAPSVTVVPAGSTAANSLVIGRRPASSLDALAAVASRWRLLLTPPASGAYNMALDHALVHRAARTGEAVLRVYTWQEATVSFGRHQPARQLYDRAAIAGAGLGVVRRPTGGRAVVHDREITYSVTARLSAPPGAAGQRRQHSRALYAAINDLLVAALARLGVSAATADRISTAAVRRPSAPGPCFDEAAVGEIVARGRKLVGSAQWRERGAVLQHGSILVADDQSRLARLLHHPVSAAASTATLGALLGRGPSAAEVADALRGALDGALLTAQGRAAEVLAIDAETAADALALHTHYAGDEWTWRL